MAQTRIHKPGPGDKVLEQVIKLADANSKWLGFFPREAFSVAAADGRILAALTVQEQRLCGYLLYFIARHRAKIQHLCIADKERGSGIGRTLVDQLKQQVAHFDGIALHCARSYPSHSFWPRLGFTAIDEKKGRGKDQQALTLYWFDNSSSSLFERTYADLAQSTLPVVIDANVFIAIYGKSDDQDSESIALTAGWLHDEVTLFVTDETFNEIDRQGDESHRKSMKGVARGIPKVLYAQKHRAAALAKVTKLLPTTKNRADESDRRQLAIATAGGFAHFVTRDESLRTMCQRAEGLGIEVLRPSELIIHLDQQRRTWYVAPTRHRVPRMYHPSQSQPLRLICSLSPNHSLDILGAGSEDRP